MSVAPGQLWAAIQSGSFWTISDEELLHVIKSEFRDELEHLKHAYSVRNHGWSEVPGSPSRILYPNGDIYDEVNRSLTGVLSLRWINANDYDKFTCCQPQSQRLCRASFDWIRGIFESQGIINSRSYKLYALVASMVSNDLGKSASFINSYLEATGDDVSRANHDMVLHRAAQRGMVPALERLRPEVREDIKRGIKLGAEFNVGQLAQAENAPASLAPLLELIGHENAWCMRWMEQLLDIAGAAGHENHTCAQKLIEPIFQSYASVYNIVCNIVERKASLREGYDQNLSTRYQLILHSGWQPSKQLDVGRPSDRALMRLFCMGNVADPRAADLYYDVFYGSLISDHIRQQLIRSLNRDGTVDKPAVQPTYGPGMMNLALSNLATAQRQQGKSIDSSSARQEQQRTLAAMLRYLARVYSEPASSSITAKGNVTVIERDIRVAIRDVIESDEFRANPDILDNARLPVDAVANTFADMTRARI